ncbi:M20/M25/M40 family metallo-hydrolase [Sorangium sp. So ce362]|uniref:M20/M25/M40 family metallo-hydrolase n=1 Tax=Sorangium sp. So ce362 TaxID=3133303 RepID=UPI003F5F9B62
MWVSETRRGSAPAPRARLEVDEEELREHVGWLSVRRHFWRQAAANRRVGERLADWFASFGYGVSIEGPFRNVVAVPARAADGPLTLVCAHYDSVPSSPGADDNASGVAVALAVARALARAAPGAPVAFVAFNGEEDGMAGSADFVARLAHPRRLRVREAHVLEMVGFTSRARGSQRAPLPAAIPGVPDVGDFLGLLGSGPSNESVAALLRAAEIATPDLRVVGLRTYLGVDRLLPVLHRSDHAPFWRAGIPAVLWTDTAEFRNPNYHRDTDLPGTLDFAFMQRVAELLLANVARAGA